MKRLCAILITTCIFAFPLAFDAPAGKNKKNIKPRQIHVESNRSDRSLNSHKVNFAASQADTHILAEYDFNNGYVCDAQSWISVDLNTQIDTFFHVDDFSGLNGGDFGRLTPLEGQQSLWCGARPTSGVPLCTYGCLPGYGNHWVQIFESKRYPVLGDASIRYRVRWDCEPGYDYTYAEYLDTLGDWHELPVNGVGVYEGIGEKSESFVVSAAEIGDSLTFRFRFVSDGSWSDEDCLWDTDGAVIIDSLAILDATGTLDFQNFEGEAVGDLTTSDGDWSAVVIPGYGHFTGLYHGGLLLQEAPCEHNSSCMWSFINGTDEYYTCGGHPEQAAVPRRNERGQYINEEIWSPEIPMTGSGTIFNLEFDVYRDLPLDNLMFYVWHVRSIDANGCPGDWRDRNFVYYGGNKDWLRNLKPIGDLVEPSAVSIQIALGCVDMCPYWCMYYGYGYCHSHAPLFDNVEVYRVEHQGPQWSVRDIDLFNDTFPENGTSTGTGRIDMALDRMWSNSPNILPGDSAKVLVSDPETALRDPDPYTGFGAALYFYMYRAPATKPMPLDQIEEDGFRWPLVDSVNCGGHKWYQFRLDTCFTEPDGPRTGSVPDAFCIDIGDQYFTNGDTIWFFFGGENAANQWTWWSQDCGTVNTMMEVCSSPMEMQILPGAGPTRGGDILYVDNFSGRGAQPYFDSAFKIMNIFDQVDRFDKRGPTSLWGNGLGYHATTAQLIGSYRKIIWNSGDMSVGTVGDGTDEKADSYQRLYEFLDQHTDPNGAGIYFSGDDLAYELNGMTSVSSIAFKNTYMPHNVISGNHVGMGLPITPLGIGEVTGPSSVGIFDHGVPFGADTIVVYGGCPVINDFDVIAPFGAATFEMTYNGDPSRPAVVAFDTMNSQGNPVATVLSGFSYHYIRDDRPVGIPDRADHLTDIIRYLGNILDDPTEVLPVARFSNSLSQNYPNPFNPVTVIPFSLKERGFVSIHVYDVSGRLVRTLVNEVRETGIHADVTWDGRNSTGHPVASGIYFYKLIAKNFTQAKKMVLLR
jgi:hypothetical protein